MKAKYKRGDLVWAYYHNGNPGPAKILRRLFFKREHHFCYNREKYPEGKCYWYLVKTDAGTLRTYPETCIDPLLDKINANLSKQIVEGNETKSAELLYMVSDWDDRCQKFYTINSKK